MEWAHHHSLVMMMISMSVLYCVDAQAGTTANPSFGYTLRENLRATMSVMLVTFFAAFVFMGFFSLYLYHCSYRYVAHHQSPLMAATEVFHGGVNRQVIDKCPILAYSAVKGLKMGRSGELECAVCLSEFQDYDEIRLLPKCHHIFHPHCIDEWLLPHMTCPVCRTTLSSDAVTTDTNNIAATTTAAAAASSTTTTETEQQQQHVVVCDDVDIGEGGEGDITVIVPPCEARALDGKFPRSHSTGHSLVELPEQVVDRYTLRLPEHVRRQILTSYGSVPRLAACNDVVLPAGAWSSKRVCYRGESNNELVSVMTPPPLFVSVSANDDDAEVDGRRRCLTPLTTSFTMVDDGPQKSPPRPSV